MKTLFLLKFPARNIKSSQCGFALLETLFATLIVSMIIAGVSRSILFDIKISKMHLLKMNRNLIGSQIAGQLTNPQTLRTSAQANVPFSSGNAKLCNCLGLNTLSILGLTCPQGSSNTKACIANTAYDFMLIPQKNYYFPPSKSIKSLDTQSSIPANCPSLATANYGNNDISCFLSGQRQNKTVGRSFNGMSGTWGKDFPLGIRTQFKAVCKDNANSCYFAEKIMLKYRITPYHTSSFKKYIQVGPYPTDPNTWYTVSRNAIIGSQCNTGAVVTEILDDGSVTCACHRPYTQDYVTTGVPRMNAMGPLCKLISHACPSGFMTVGQKKDGSPECALIASSTITYPKNFNSNSLGTQNTGATYSCNEAGTQGWFSQLKFNCDVQAATFVSKDGKPKANTTAVVVGYVIGVMIGAVIGGLTGGIGAILIGELIGALAGFFSGLFGFLSWDWYIYLESPKNPCMKVGDSYKYCPTIICYYRGNCTHHTLKAQ